VQLALAIAWLVVGTYAMASALRQRRYVGSLPPTAGNRKFKQQRIAILVFGIIAIVGGLWRLAIALGLSTALSREP
jgi:uncharacterized membrane protein HdeD (DUF308 family)